LFSAKPTKGYNDVLQSDDPEDNCFEVDDVGSDVVALPEDNSKDKQHQCD